MPHGTSSASCKHRCGLQTWVLLRRSANKGLQWVATSAPTQQWKVSRRRHAPRRIALAPGAVCLRHQGLVDVNDKAELGMDERVQAMFVCASSIWCAAAAGVVVNLRQCLGARWQPPAECGPKAAPLHYCWADFPSYCIRHAAAAAAGCTAALAWHAAHGAAPARRPSPCACTPR